MSSPAPIVASPATYVTQHALVLGAPGAPAEPVGPDHPLPVHEQPFATSATLTPGGADSPPRRAVQVACSASGDVALKLADGGTLIVPVEAGLSILPFAVRGVVVAGTTAVASYASLG